MSDIPPRIRNPATAASTASAARANLTSVVTRPADIFSWFDPIWDSIDASVTPGISPIIDAIVFDATPAHTTRPSATSLAAAQPPSPTRSTHDSIADTCSAPSAEPTPGPAKPHAPAAAAAVPGLHSSSAQLASRLLQPGRRKHCRGDTDADEWVNTARGYAYRMSAAFATPASAAVFEPEPLPADRYPTVTRADFARYFSQLRASRAAQGVPPGGLGPGQARARDDATAGLPASVQRSSSSQPQAAVPGARTPVHIPVPMAQPGFNPSVRRHFACLLTGKWPGYVSSDRLVEVYQGRGAEHAEPDAAAWAVQEADADSITGAAVRPALMAAAEQCSEWVEGVEAELCSRVQSRQRALFALLADIATLGSGTTSTHATAQKLLHRMRTKVLPAAQAKLLIVAKQRRLQRLKALRAKAHALQGAVHALRATQQLVDAGELDAALHQAESGRALALEQLSGLDVAQPLVDKLNSAVDDAVDAAAAQWQQRAAGHLLSGATSAELPAWARQAGAGGEARLRAFIQGWQDDAAPASSPALGDWDEEVADDSLAPPAACDAAVLEVVLSPQWLSLAGVSFAAAMRAMQQLEKACTRDAKTVVRAEAAEVLKTIALRQVADHAGSSSGTPRGEDGSAMEAAMVAAAESMAAGSQNAVGARKLTTMPHVELMELLRAACTGASAYLGRVRALVQSLIMAWLAQDRAGDAGSPGAGPSTPPPASSSAQALGKAGRAILYSATAGVSKNIARMLRARSPESPETSPVQLAALAGVMTAAANEWGAEVQELAELAPADVPPMADACAALATATSDHVHAEFARLHKSRLGQLISAVENDQWKSVPVPVRLAMHALQCAAIPMLSSPHIAWAPYSFAQVARVLAKVELDAGQQQVRLYRRGQADAGNLSLHLLQAAADQPTEPLPALLIPEPHAVRLLSAPSSPTSDGPSSPLTAVTAAVVQAVPIPVAACALVLVRTLSEYTGLVRLVPGAAAPAIMMGSLELVRTFNKRTSVLVLGGGAVSKGTLKTIYAKHLATALQSVTAVHKLLPSALNSVLACVSSARAVALRADTGRVLADLQRHADQLIDKFVAIVQQLAESTLASLGQAQWGDPAEYAELANALLQPERCSDLMPAAPPPCSDGMQQLVAGLRTISKILRSILAPAQVDDVLSRIAVMLSSAVPTAYSSVHAADVAAQFKLVHGAGDTVDVPSEAAAVEAPGDEGMPGEAADDSAESVHTSAESSDTPASPGDATETQATRLDIQQVASTRIAWDVLCCASVLQHAVPTPGSACGAVATSLATWVSRVHHVAGTAALSAMQEPAD